MTDGVNSKFIYGKFAIRKRSNCFSPRLAPNLGVWSSRGGLAFASASLCTYCNYDFLWQPWCVVVEAVPLTLTWNPNHILL